MYFKTLNFMIIVKTVLNFLASIIIHFLMFSATIKKWISFHVKYKDIFVCMCAVLGFELRALHLLVRYWITWAIAQPSSDSVLCVFLELTSDWDPPTHSSWVTGIIGKNHHVRVLLLRWGRVLWSFCVGWLQTAILLISASWVTRIIGLCYHACPEKFIHYLGENVWIYVRFKKNQGDPRKIRKVTCKSIIQSLS
jgi:hypothetical protein